jgi:hypothetical protein
MNIVEAANELHEALRKEELPTDTDEKLSIQLAQAWNLYDRATKEEGRAA